ncbi:MAG: hypothetical protein NTY38_13880, partial [Acidobacteria bacterium]|nr:hypothetical protein [Acidobacteriota bacterium]
RAGIPSTERVRIAMYPARQSFFEKLLSRSMQNSVDPRIEALWKQLDLPLWSQGGMMQVMPYRIDFR